MSTTIPIQDWTYEHGRAVDGDTVAGWLSQVVQIPGWDVITRTPLLAPVKLRLVTLDTPERGEVGWSEARVQVQAWLTRTPDLRAQLYGYDAFGRLLADIYRAADRTDTLSQHMLRSGWLPWQGSR